MGAQGGGQAEQPPPPHPPLPLHDGVDEAAPPRPSFKPEPLFLVWMEGIPASTLFDVEFVEPCRLLYGAAFLPDRSFMADRHDMVDHPETLTWGVLAFKDAQYARECGMRVAVAPMLPASRLPGPPKRVTVRRRVPGPQPTLDALAEEFARQEAEQAGAGVKAAVAAAGRRVTDAAEQRGPGGRSLEAGEEVAGQQRQTSPPLSVQAVGPALAGAPAGASAAARHAEGGQQRPAGQLAGSDGAMEPAPLLPDDEDLTGASSGGEGGGAAWEAAGASAAPNGPEQQQAAPGKARPAAPLPGTQQPPSCQSAAGQRDTQARATRPQHGRPPRQPAGPQPPLSSPVDGERLQKQQPAPHASQDKVGQPGPRPRQEQQQPGPAARPVGAGRGPSDPAAKAGRGRGRGRGAAAGRGRRPALFDPPPLPRGAAQQEHAASPRGRDAAAAAEAAPAAPDESLRQKVRVNYLAPPLMAAARELRQAGGEGREWSTADVTALAAEVEAALLEAHSGETNRQYRERVRALSTNLKDNPELRAHVLRRDIPPAVFVRMTADELAKKDLQEHRRHLQQLSLRNAVLPPEVAALKSTRAALDLRRAGLLPGPTISRERSAATSQWGAAASSVSKRGASPEVEGPAELVSPARAASASAAKPAAATQPAAATPATAAPARQPGAGVQAQTRLPRIRTAAPPVGGSPPGGDPRRRLPVIHSMPPPSPRHGSAASTPDSEAAAAAVWDYDVLASATAPPLLGPAQPPGRRAGTPDLVDVWGQPAPAPMSQPQQQQQRQQGAEAPGRSGTPDLQRLPEQQPASPREAAGQLGPQREGTPDLCDQPAEGAAAPGPPRQQQGRGARRPQPWPGPLQAERAQRRRSGTPDLLDELAAQQAQQAQRASPSRSATPDLLEGEGQRRREPQGASSAPLKPAPAGGGGKDGSKRRARSRSPERGGREASNPAARKDGRRAAEPARDAGAQRAKRARSEEPDGGARKQERVAAGPRPFGAQQQGKDAVPRGGPAARGVVLPPAEEVHAAAAQRERAAAEPPTLRTLQSFGVEHHADARQLLRTAAARAESPEAPLPPAAFWSGRVDWPEGSKAALQLCAAAVGWTAPSRAAPPPLPRTLVVTATMPGRDLLPMLTGFGARPGQLCHFLLATGRSRGADGAPTDARDLRDRMVGVCIVSLSGQQMDTDDVPWQRRCAHCWFLHLVPPSPEIISFIGADVAKVAALGPGTLLVLALPAWYGALYANLQRKLSGTPDCLVRMLGPPLLHSLPYDLVAPTTLRMSMPHYRQHEAKLREQRMLVKPRKTPQDQAGLACLNRFLSDTQKVFVVPLRRRPRAPGAVQEIAAELLLFPGVEAGRLQAAVWDLFWGTRANRRVFDPWTFSLD